jgi:hypothetical protein
MINSTKRLSFDLLERSTKPLITTTLIIPLFVFIISTIISSDQYKISFNNVIDYIWPIGANTAKILFSLNPQHGFVFVFTSLLFFFISFFYIAFFVIYSFFTKAEFYIFINGENTIRQNAVRKVIICMIAFLLSSSAALFLPESATIRNGNSRGLLISMYFVPLYSTLGAYMFCYGFKIFYQNYYK